MAERLIDADKLKLALLKEDGEIHQYCFPCRQILKAIDEAETVERKYGKWIVMNDDYIDDCKCSKCGCIEYFYKGWKRFNFCPNCGADMREETEDIPMEYFESGGK